jgi:hypothetical protein
MFKKPSIRKKINLDTTSRHEITRGVVYDILHPPKPPIIEKEKRFYYQNSELYLKLLKRNYEYYKIPFKKPQVFDPPIKNVKYMQVENHINYPDMVVVKLNILKSGIVRVKVLTSMVTLWEKYYSKSKTPPPKSVISAYKHMGYSETFLKNLQKQFEKKKVMKIKIEKLIERIFEKAPKKKVRVVPKKEDKKIDTLEDELGEPPEDDENEDDDDVRPEEDEAIVEDGDDADEDVVDDTEPVDVD